MIGPRQPLYQGRALHSRITKRKANWKNASIQPKYGWPVKANTEQSLMKFEAESSESIP